MDLLGLMQEVFDNMYVTTQMYLRRLSFVDHPVPYNGPLCGFMDFLIPLLNATRALSGGYALHSRLPHILWLADPPTAHVLYHL